MSVWSDKAAGPAAGRARISLGFKISAVLVVSLTLAGAATSFLVTQQMHSALVEEYRSKGEGISRGLATAVVALIVREDKAKVQASVDEFSKTSGIAYIALNDAAGALLGGAYRVQRADAPTPDGAKGEAAFPTELFTAIGGKEELQIDAKIDSKEVELPALGKFLDISYPIMNGALGRAHVGLDLGLIEHRLSALGRNIILEFAAFVGLAVAVAYVLSRVIVRPLFDMVQVLGRVSTGDLNDLARLNSEDEFKILGESLNRMIRGLRGIVSSVRMASVQVNDASEEIVATARDQERAVTEQVSGLEEISQTMNALTDTARAISNNADSTRLVTAEMSADVRRGQEALSASRDSVAQIVEQNTIIVDRINKLFEQSEAIIAVIDIIDNISDRLDLLALNAALEGSRAGEVGKGFSLVAAEMRRLAENVQESTKEIKGTIQEIHGLIRAALEASQAGTDRTRVGSQEVEKTVEIMSKIFRLIESTALSTQQITIITQQQLSSSQQIATAMRDVANIATQGVASSREVSRAAADLAGLSSTLQSQVAVFRVSEAQVGQSEERP